MSGLRELEGRVAIVTGSARNIGRVMALELARAGAAVMVNVRSSQDEANAVAREIIAEGGKAAVTLGDVTDPQAVDALIEATAEQHIVLAGAPAGRCDVSACSCRGNVGAGHRSSGCRGFHFGTEADAATHTFDAERHGRVRVVA